MEAKQLVGRKYLKVLQQYLADLRKLYDHHNRVLFYDDVVVSYLMAFFNPTINSLRCIEDASQLPGINQFLSVESVCRSTLSDANALFDPQHLQGLINHLREDLPNLHQTNEQLDQLLARSVAIDGSYFRVAADVQWALVQRKPDGKKMGQVRLNCQFCLQSGCPSGVSICGDEGKSEGAAAQQLLAADAEKPAASISEASQDDCIYLFDSGVVKFSFLRQIAIDRKEHFLCNLSQGIGVDVEKDLPVSEQAAAKGVLSDRLVRLRSSHAPRGIDAAPDVLMREIRIAYTDRHGKAKELRLLTNLLDLPVLVLAELYKHRWEIELFFRWLKVHAHFRHLTSYSKNGVMLSFYTAIIAMLLTCLHTQHPLSKYGYNLMCMVADGLGDVQDILPILKRREHERKLEKDRLARKRAATNKK